MKTFILILSASLWSLSQCLAPNEGDIRLYNSQEARSLKGELQIYITDGHSPLGWSRVCNTEHFDNDEAEVCCKQLGLSPDGRIISEMTGSNYPAKIKDIDCGTSTHRRHILQCEHKIGNFSSCPDTVFIKCFNTTADTLTDGELTLCQPDNVTNEYLTSTSFGVVITSFNKKEKAIGYHAVSVGSSDLADIMCASMGYQKSVPGSVMTAKALAGMYNFSTCNQRVADSSWIDMSQLICNSTQQYPCFGCCLEYLTQQACSKKSCVGEFLVLQCVFDPLHSNWSSTRYVETCVFGEEAQEGDKIINYTSICTLPDQPLTQWNSYSRAFGGVALAEFLVITIIVLWLCLKNLKDKCGKVKYINMSQPIGQP